MTVYDTELAAFSRTPQVIVELGITSCQNFYSQTIVQCLWETEAFDDGGVWTKTGGTTITPDSVAAPDGTTSADTLAFAAAGDYIKGPSIGIDTAPSKAFTGSVWLRAAAPGTITLKITDNAPSETGSLQVNVTTTWTRFFLHKLFTAGAAGAVWFRIERAAGDLASIYAWGANMYRNPGDVDADVKFPYRPSVAFVISDPRQQVLNCQAADAGNGSRCWYSFPTCQDPANFNVGHPYETSDLQGLKVFRFCMKNAPLPIGGADIYPLIQSVDFTPQKIDPERAVTVNERITLTCYDDAATWTWNQDKVSAGAKANTTTPSGSFFRRFMAMYRNYANPRNYARVYVGFVAAGMDLTLYKLRGSYLITDMQIRPDGMVTIDLADRLRLTKTTKTGTSQARAPAKISQTNLLNGAINNSQTTMVVDASFEITTPGSGYNVCLELEPNTGNQEYVNVTAKDDTTGTCTIQRGRWGTTAKSHADNVPFREVLQFGTEATTPSLAPHGKNIIDCAIELLLRTGSIALTDIDTTTLYDERDTWLNGSVTGDVESGILVQRAGGTPDSGGNAAIATQDDIETYLKQLREIGLLNLWVNESNQITGRVFAPARPTVVLASLDEATAIVKNSLSVDDNEDSRVTRVLIATTLMAGKSGGSPGDYQNISVTVGTNEEAAGSYGDIRTKVILSPWLRSSDTGTIARLGSHYFLRYRNPARRVSFSLELKDDSVKCGDFANLTTTWVQKPDGTSDGPRVVEILSKQRKSETVINYESLDTGLTTRYGFVAPAGYPDYDAATADQRRSGYIGTAVTNKVGTAADPGYYVW